MPIEPESLESVLSSLCLSIESLTTEVYRVRERLDTTNLKLEELVNVLDSEIK